MSQGTPSTPSVVVNAANNRQQVPLRDYLNARVAPFLKKAVTESLGVEAEFPLQWLGECLIHQSTLYEGNPDRTNIRERFLYKFEAPIHQEELPTAPAHSEPPEVQQHEPERPEIAMHESAESTLEPPIASEASAPQAPSPQDTTVTNGVKVEEKDEKDEKDLTKDADTEMGGTS
ncbi:hypothetical protein A1O3_09376 [Capronia epimyces CBS 606.96]|uniref:Uncharacterized protein n=1 Tax=Capronia epimyces CBS 606.96 TaxID=1182542 RepID=W9XLK4_9EURO|nr:uncharacterized protein A1O3_09376 [Capronia epimyces CBS 606.96]EXJ78215.1 hypothetical protein A1O3_09376 [Capronia epimyces CBS 606.96]